MNTRSQRYTKVLSITRVANNVCSYCNIKGHKINNCEHESINELDIFGNYTIALGYFIFGFTRITSYTKWWLNSLDSKQLQIIGYKHKLGNKKFIDKHLYINDLIKIYKTNQLEPGYESRFNDLIFNLDSEIINQFYKDMEKCINDIGGIKRKLNDHRKFVKYPMQIHFNNLTQNAEDTCPICIDDTIESNCIYMGCNHSICISCFIKILCTERNQLKTNVNCPLCRRHVDEISLCKSNQSKIERFCSIELYNKQLEEIEKQKNKKIKEDMERMKQLEEIENIKKSERKYEENLQHITTICYKTIGILKVVLWLSFIVYSICVYTMIQ